MARKPKLRLHASGQYCTSAGCEKGGLKYFGRVKRQAEIAFKEYLESLKGNQVERTGRVDDLCDTFLESLGTSDAAVAQRTWGLSQWTTWIIDGTPNGARIAADVRKADLEAFIKHLEKRKSERTGKPLSATSINHVIAAIKHCWSWAAAQDPPLLDRDPLASVAKLVEPEREPEYIQRKDVARILRYARADRSAWKMYAMPDRPPSENEFRAWAVLLRLSYHTGLRLSELCKLDWSSVHLDDRQIRIKMHKTAKRTGRTRKIPLDNAAYRILNRMDRRKGNVFLNRDGDPFRPESLTLRFRRLRKKLRLPETFRLTSMRHTVASDLLRAGESTKMVADILGHTSTRMVEKVYGHLLDQDHRDATERREEFRARHRSKRRSSS